MDKVNNDFKIKLIYNYGDVLKNIINGKVVDNLKKQAIFTLRDLAKEDELLETTINLLNKCETESQIDEVINDYILKLKDKNDKNDKNDKADDNKNNKNVEEQISELFGIDVSNIDHIYLNSGVEIFKYYDKDNDKDVILYNNRDGVSLSEQLEEIRNNKDNKKELNDNSNTMDMMDDKRKESIELKLYPIEEVKNNKDLLNGLTEDNKVIALYLITYSEELNIKSINLDNLIYINNEGKMIETYKNKDTGELEMNEVNVKEKEKNDAKEIRDEEVNPIELGEEIDLDYDIEDYDVLEEVFEKDKPKVLVKSNKNDGYGTMEAILLTYLSIGLGIMIVGLSIFLG